MAKSRKKYDLGLRLKPSDVATTLEGEIRIGDSSKFVYAFVDGAEREILSADQDQIVTNKRIDADNNTISNLETDNLKAGVLNTAADLTGASDTQLASALAVKTYVDDSIATKDQAIDISFDDDGNTKVLGANVQEALDATDVALGTKALATDLSDHLADAVDAHDASAISNVPSGNLAATDVQGALDELQSDIDTRVVDGGSFTSGSVITPDRLDVKQSTLDDLQHYAAGTGIYVGDDPASNGQLVFATDEKKMYQVVDTELQPVGGASGTVIEIDQPSHGFSVGNGIYHNGSAWAQAQANDGSTLATFVVTEVSPDGNSFVAYQFGRVEVPSHGFTEVGEYYFLSNTVAGQPTATEPTSDYSNPLFYVEDANTLQILVYRPSVVGNQTSIDELSDVSVPAPNDGEVLTYVAANSRFEAVPAAVPAASAVSYDDTTSGNGQTDVQGAIDDNESRVQAIEDARGVADGYASLDSGGKVPVSELPDAVLGGSGIPLLSKGSLLTSDGANNGELTVGTDGQILIADSTQAAGLRWDAAPSGGGGGGNFPLVNLKNANTKSITGANYVAGAFGGGNFVFVNSGTNNQIQQGISGYDWQVRTAPETASYTDVAYGNGVFVGVSNSATNRVIRSTDGGATWSSVSVTANGWKSITYSPSLGRFVAVALSGTDRVMYSDDDGLTWTDVNVTAGTYFGVAWSPDLNLFAAVATSGNQIMTSPDGITWTNRTAPAANEWTYVTYGRDRFVACARTGSGNRVMYSTDGITWTAGQSSSNNTFEKITYGNGIFVMPATTAGIVSYSYDGVKFYQIASPASQNYQGVAFGNGMFAFGGTFAAARIGYTDLDTSVL